MAILSELELALVNSWSKETSLDPDNWAPANSALGQCAVTALIINDYLGGRISLGRSFSSKWRKDIALF